MSGRSQQNVGAGRPAHRDEVGDYHLVGRRAEVVIVSSSAAAGTAEDRCGPLLRDWLGGRGMEVRVHVVPDGPQVLALLRELTGESRAGHGPRLVITSGGTGLNSDDVTPEATARVVERESPGIVHALWARGGSPAELTQRAVAVVGTRAITRYGWEVTRMLVEGLAASRWTIVSGGALGVDTVAHETALANGTPTIVVAACGQGRTYPARNAALFDRIAGDGARGAVISEYPPGVHPARHRFLTRNRLVAALSGGTVVVEAAWRSGALNTLTWAARLGSVAMAVPGPVTGYGSLGCHERIRNGDAQLVTSAEQIRELIEPLGTVDAQAQYEFAFPPDRIQALSRTELKVFDATSSESRVTGDVAAEAGITVSLAVHILVDLQQKGLVQRDGVSWRRSG